MIRLSEIKLPLSDAENPATPLQAAAAGILHLTPADILRVDVFKRSFDARKAELMAVYIVDVEVAPTLEATLLAKFTGNPHIQPTPDMTWRPPAHAAANGRQRPVV